jgi:Uma2 family endonuclease
VSTIARLTLADYDRMIQAGVFDQGRRRRLEFIRGEIRDMTPIGSQHSEIVQRLAEWSIEILRGRSIRAWVQDAIRLRTVESCPEPDLAWVIRRDYSDNQPEDDDVLLVVEVAETSLTYDTGEKAELHAAAGIADYWVVDVSARAIEVRREPVGGRYRSLKTHLGDEEVRPLAVPEVALQPSVLFESQTNAQC